jgi:hypothetical protein
MVDAHRCTVLAAAVHDAVRHGRRRTAARLLLDTGAHDLQRRRVGLFGIERDRDRSVHRCDEARVRAADAFEPARPHRRRAAADRGPDRRART